MEVLGEDEDGWWRGRVGERMGLFPSNFVEVIEEEARPPSLPPVQEPAPVLPPHESADGPLMEKREEGGK